jgi:hypothetical protein
MELAERYAYPTYTLRKKVFKIFGDAFHIYDPDDNVVLYSKLKAFKLREDIRIYTDESQDEEVLQIRTKSLVDFSGSYEVFDSAEREPVGMLRRKGMKSILKDEWLIFDAAGGEIGVIKEDSTLKAVVRRVIDDISFLMPQAFHAEVGGQDVARYKQNFNPFVQKIQIDFTADTSGLLDPRLGLAAAVLLCAIEGKQ